METTGMKVADLDDEKLAKLRELEGELGVCLVALEEAFSLARLSPDQVERLQDAERELGVVLLAYTEKKASS